jgi:integrase
MMKRRNPLQRSEPIKDFLRLYIEPHWGSCKLREVRAVAVEKWLKNLTKKDGEPFARPTKAKIRNIMSAVFNHAIRYEFLPQGMNPITLVRQSAKRMRVPDVLDAAEVAALFTHLSARDRVMVLLDASTGLRRSELMGLKWVDLDFEQLEISVTRSVYQSVVGKCKTEASRKPVPLDPWVAEELLMWKQSAPYNQPDDWIFASPRTKGKRPYQPDMILQRGIRPVAEKAGITKRIGWHTFRHTFSTLLQSGGADVKVMQELLRHANSRITLDIYTQAMSPEKRKAQTSVVKMFLKGGGKKKAVIGP